MEEGYFQFVVHHSGTFCDARYVGGDTSTRSCDSDRWSYFEIVGILKDMGFLTVQEMWYSRGGCEELENRLWVLTLNKLLAIKKLNDVHTCARQFKVDLLSTIWLSGRLETSLSQNPKLRSNDVRNKAVKKWNTSISKSKAQRTMTMALKTVQVSFQEQYKQISDYAHEVMRANPGSTMKVKVEDMNGLKVFGIFYVCLKGCKDSFISCRPIIALDECFLKDFYGGELLTAVGRDPNDQMLPLAYVVVEVKCKDSWTWFL